MTIRKHLRNLFLVSTALFWANCSNDSAVSSPATIAEGNASNQDSIGSSSSVESSSEQATSEENNTESSSSEDTNTESSSSEDTNTESSSSETSVKQSSSSEEQRKYTMINKTELLPNSCEPNRYGITPGHNYFIDDFANGIGRSRIEEILSDSSAFADSTAQETKECLKSILDTISYFTLLYGTSPYAVLDVKCSDGSTYFSQVVKKYAEQNDITEEETFQVSEQYDKDVKKRLQKIKQQIDGCLQTETEPFENHCSSNIADNSKEECDIEKMPYKEVTLGISTCYGKNAKDDSGKDIEIIECDKMFGMNKKMTMIRQL